MKVRPAGRIHRHPGSPLRCPLCSGEDSRIFMEANARLYLRCPDCALTYLSPPQRVDPMTERARYETHENDPSDPRYRQFLDQLAIPLGERLPSGASGLDFGSGPGPTLSVMMEERGFHVEIYDPFFAPQGHVLARTYDFITCSEVAEHLFEPGAELSRFDRMLRPGGWVGIMTQILDDDDAFSTWYYVRDWTHVCFYRAETLQWIARRHNWYLERPGQHVALFQKPVSV